ncbi:MAG: ice-binding family protein, partial [Gaiellaceae bacterium]
MAFASNAGATAAPVPLGTAGSFAILAGTSVTDVPTSTISGDVGVSPGPWVPGLTCAEVSGTIYSVDASGPLPCRVTNPGLLTTAKNDLTTAYGDAFGRSPDTTFIGADNQLGGQALVPGVYRFPHATTANLIGNLTLNGGPGAVWIFQATSDLVTAVGSSVTFSGGAGPCNVYWQIGTTATINGASFAGTVMAADSITMCNGVNLSGRTLASTGNVTLISDTISASSCSAASTPNPPQPRPREIYCTPAGVAYDLVAGQDKLPPYDKLGLVPAYVDPVTGSKSCTFPPAPTPVAPTPVVPTPVPTPVVPPPVVTTPTPAQ